MTFLFFFISVILTFAGFAEGLSWPRPPHVITVEKVVEIPVDHIVEIPVDHIVHVPFPVEHEVFVLRDHKVFVSRQCPSIANELNKFERLNHE